MKARDTAATMTRTLIRYFGSKAGGIRRKQIAGARAGLRYCASALEGGVYRKRARIERAVDRPPQTSSSERGLCSQRVCTLARNDRLARRIATERRVLGNMGILYRRGSSC